MPRVHQIVLLGHSMSSARSNKSLQPDKGELSRYLQRRISCQLALPLNSVVSPGAALVRHLSICPLQL
jgi:hypothetical protein